MNTIKLKMECKACDGEGFDENDVPCEACEEGLAEVEFPAKFEVCERCRGKGSHCNPAIDGNGLSREDFDEDPDFEEAYFRGDYDVSCYECKGLRVVPVVDEERLSDAARAQLAACERRSAQIAQWDAEDRHTRRMESGGW